MLNINQNFDLKAPVFNFDRDYFNSVEELNAYDTSNVPNHFVTNVGGMLYQFTDGAWIPMIGTMNSAEDDGLYFTNIGSNDITISTSSDSAHVYNALMVAHPNSGKNVSLSVNNSGPEVWLQGSTNGNRANIKVSDDAPSLELTEDDTVTLSVSPTGITATSDSTDITASSIKMLTNKELTEEKQADGYSQVDISLTDSNNSASINAGYGFTHKSDDGFTSKLDKKGLITKNLVSKSILSAYALYMQNANGDNVIYLQHSTDKNDLVIGSDSKFKISRPVDDTEGATITGIKSLTAFANPSATKVWATDGSTVDLTTKANTSDLDAKANKSDVLLKKSVSGGYYIERNSNKLGGQAFAANNACTASAYHSFAEGSDTEASGNHSHAEGGSTEASGFCSHAEGSDTIASGRGSHAQGVYNIDDLNAIHSVGIGNNTARKNAEYIYAKNNAMGYLVDDPKNGYKYLIGVGGYDGISTDNTTYKSVQEVIADLTARIEQLETKVKALETANTPA